MGPLKEDLLKAVYIVLLAGVLALTLLLYRTVQLGRGSAQAVTIDNLNPRDEIVGPDGIQFDAAGNLYIGDTQGIVWNLGRGGSAEIYARLQDVQQSAGSPPAGGLIQVGGLIFDAQGQLYATAGAFAGGSVLQVDAGTRAIRFFARDMGIAACLAITNDSRYLWVSDYRKQGRILRYPLDGALPAQPDVVVAGLEYPNGIALGKDEKALYVAESLSGNVTRIDLTGSKPQIQRIINLSGLLAVGRLDGLAFDPRDIERRFLYVAENLRGMFTVVDLQAQAPHAVKRLSMLLMGGRPCPANMVIRDGYLHFTDLWACSPIRILLGVPKWHTHAFRFRVINMANLY
jgi:sugar lactone lactonase YvrE